MVFSIVIEYIKSILSHGPDDKHDKSNIIQISSFLGRLYSMELLKESVVDYCFSIKAYILP